MTKVDEKSFIEQMKKAIDDMNRQQLEGVLPEGTMINV